MATHIENESIAYLSDASPAKARWRLGILSAGHGVTHMQGAVMPLIYPILMNSMGFGYVELGGMLTFTRLVNGFLQGIWGAVAKYLSGRDIIVMENICVGIGIGLCGLAHNFAELTGYVTFGQIAASPHHPIGSAMLSKWFSKTKRGAAQAIHFATANVATVICPLLATLLISLVGWRATLYVFTLPGLVIGVIILFSMPAEMLVAKSKNRLSFTAGFFEPLKSRSVRRLIATASITAGGKGIGIMQTFLPLFFLNQLHYSKSITGVLFTLFTVTSVVGPMIAGKLSDHFQRPKFLSFLLYGACAMSFVMVLFSTWTVSVWLLSPILVIMGLFVYGYSPVEQTIMSDITANDLQASAYSLFFGMTFAASSLWPLVLSIVVSHFGFTAFFVLVGLSYLAGALIYWRGNWSAGVSADVANASS
ncbi:MFS transporter [Alicyclobacillus fastidiosus]|uniref:MFS transporter n=1 Tax=Alicyclobacillus fastidiosus TaxID=392011 RepID=A0ABV5AIK4_9BACL|nr:MFS transporter [Alicyclobacillus fastidiosus]WEH07832.1 MFS transporter [Alicyclobacillus fastidiosus]